MDLNLDGDGVRKNNVHIKALMSVTNTDQGKRSNKCNECAFVSSHASSMRVHLKRHSGEKSNKCNQCNYACSDPSALRRHFKTHSEEKSHKCNQCDFASF